MFLIIVVTFVLMLFCIQSLFTLTMITGQDIIKLGVFFFVCFTVSCKTPVYEPAYSVCGKLADYPAIVAAGYDYIELNANDFLIPEENKSVFQKNVKQIKQDNVKVISCVDFIPDHMPMVGSEPKHDEIIARAKIVFNRARTAGVEYMVFNSHVPDGFDRKEATSQFITICKRLGDLAKRDKLTVIIEPFGNGDSELINSLQDGVEIIKEIDNDNIRLLCDISHMMRNNELAEEIVKYGSYIRHCRVDISPEARTDNFTAYFNALRQINFRGCVSVNNKQGKFDEHLATALQHIRQQFQSL